MTSAKLKTNKPRFQIKSIADGQQQLEDAHAVLKVQTDKVVEMADKLAASLGRVTEAERQRRSAQEQCEEMRKQLDDLKARLHNADMTNARYAGYIDRVREAERHGALE